MTQITKKLRKKIKMNGDRANMPRNKKHKKVVRAWHG